MIIRACKIDDVFQRRIERLAAEHQPETSYDHQPFEGGDLTDETEDDRDERTDDVDAEVALPTCKAHPLKCAAHGSDEGEI